MKPIQRAAIFLAVALLLTAAAVQQQAKCGVGGGPAGYMLVIHESQDDTPEQARVIDDQGWRTIADDNGTKWLVVDKDEAAKRWPTTTKIAVKAGLPQVVWLDAKGKAKAENLPLLPRGMRETVKKHGGSK